LSATEATLKSAKANVQLVLSATEATLKAATTNVQQACFFEKLPTTCQAHSALHPRRVHSNISHFGLFIPVQD
jgi:4'-phosphopantetheinyl transferase EntD